jgi:hypothetical protein
LAREEPPRKRHGVDESSGLGDLLAQDEPD